MCSLGLREHRIKVSLRPAAANARALMHGSDSTHKLVVLELTWNQQPRERPRALRQTDAMEEA